MALQGLGKLSANFTTEFVSQVVTTTRFMACEGGRRGMFPTWVPNVTWTNCWMCFKNVSGAGAQAQGEENMKILLNRYDHHVI